MFRHSGSPVRCGGCGRSGGDGGPFGAWATTAELERDADWADTAEHDRRVNGLDLGIVGVDGRWVRTG